VAISYSVHTSKSHCSPVRPDWDQMTRHIISDQFGSLSLSRQLLTNSQHMAGHPPSAGDGLKLRNRKIVDVLKWRFSVRIWKSHTHALFNHVVSWCIRIPESLKLQELRQNIVTRSQAVARIADRTASQQTLVITDALAHETPCSQLDKFPVTLSQHYSHNTALIFAAPSHSRWRI